MLRLYSILYLCSLSVTLIHGGAIRVPTSISGAESSAAALRHTDLDALPPLLGNVPSREHPVAHSIDPHSVSVTTPRTPRSDEDIRHEALPGIDYSSPYDGDDASSNEGDLESRYATDNESSHGSNSLGDYSSDEELPFDLGEELLRFRGGEPYFGIENPTDEFDVSNAPDRETVNDKLEDILQRYYPWREYLDQAERKDIIANWQDHRDKVISLQRDISRNEQVSRDVMSQHNYIEKNGSEEEKIISREDNQLMMKFKMSMELLVQAKLAELGRIRPKSLDSEHLSGTGVGPGDHHTMVHTLESIDFLSPDVYKSVEMIGSDKLTDSLVQAIEKAIRGLAHRELRAHGGGQQADLIQIVPGLITTIDFLFRNEFINRETTKSLLQDDKFLSGIAILNINAHQIWHGPEIFDGMTDVANQWFWTLNFYCLKVLDGEKKLRMNFEGLMSDMSLEGDEYEQLDLILDTISRRGYANVVLRDGDSRHSKVVDGEDLKNLEDDVEKLMMILSRTIDHKNNQLDEHLAISLSRRICEILDFIEVNFQNGILDKTFQKTQFTKNLETQYKIMLYFSRTKFLREMARLFSAFSRHFPELPPMDIGFIDGYYRHNLRSAYGKFKDQFTSIDSNQPEMYKWSHEQDEFLEILRIDENVANAMWEQAIRYAKEKQNRTLD
ncbi:hypothetical protein PSTG_02998 [Puccinia striiformis f. sp. tritici PST-78]|uniref:Nucleotide exchange factor SIL1 n=1 Tax=Puccinia striiformis f. sp. tritici PST-78 TaxID=1165861 RepID=A0A0L0VXH6_9BASI|nr:hypothetical protein PSTG_02998 [Puccinia striiformis f. sp. tritici PST-78]